MDLSKVWLTVLASKVDIVEFYVYQFRNLPPPPQTRALTGWRDLTSANTQQRLTVDTMISRLEVESKTHAFSVRRIVIWERVVINYVLFLRDRIDEYESDNCSCHASSPQILFYNPQVVV